MGLLDGILGAVLAGAGGQQGAQAAPRQMPQSAGGADPLDGLLGAILGGNPAAQQQAQQQGMSIEDVLSGISGGQSPAPQRPQQRQQQQMPSGGQGDMGDILGSILGGAMGGQPQQQQLPSGGQGGMSDILGSILGGAMGGQPQQQQLPSGGQGGLGPLGSILGAVIGGDAAGGGDLKSIAMSVSANAFLAPIVSKIAARLGLPPSVAQAIVAFAVQKLVMGAAQQRTQAPSGRVSQPQGAGPNINDILQSLGQGQRIDRRTIKMVGFADELAAEAEIDPNTAARGLQAVFDEFAGPMTTTGEQPDYSGLLQKWVPNS